MGDCNAFREELAIRYPNHGHALWDPDPGGLYDSVRVGDVGFIRDGYFYRLFNVLHPRDPSSDPETHHDHDMVYPPKLQPKEPNHIRRSIEPIKDFRSKNVTKESGGPNIYATGPDEDAVINVSCSGKQGALLSLPLAAEREDTIARGDFGKWLVKHIDDCMRIADDLGLGINRMEDIILVTGRHLARSWVSILFSEYRTGAQVSYVAQATGNSGIRLQERRMTGGDLKLGPSGENLPENQCIFLRGYRIVRILNIWPRLRGLAGPGSDIDESDPEADTGLQLISIPAETDYQDPLHVLLEYIAEQAPESDMALVHDDDLDFVVGSSLETLQPDALLDHLRNHAPAIRQVQCELIHSDEDNESGVDAEIATVATLSDVAFESSRQNPAMSRSVPSFETPSQQYEHPIATELDSRGSSSFRGNERTIFQLSDLAYEKLLLHTYKYPQQPVNGVLLGASYAPKTVTIRDAVPLQHNGMEDRSMMEVALEMATNHARTSQLHVVGYYESSTFVGDKALSSFGEHVAARIRESFPTPVALVINGADLDDESDAELVPYVSVSSSAFRQAEGDLWFDEALHSKVRHLVREGGILDKLRDFDDYLEDDSVQFLENPDLRFTLTLNSETIVGAGGRAVVK